MEHMGVALFMMLLYMGCGLVSKAIFEKYCEVLFEDWRFAEAIAILMATVWPLGWVLMILIGLGHLAQIILSNIVWAVKVLAHHFRQAVRGEQ